MDKFGLGFSIALFIMFLMTINLTTQNFKIEDGREFIISNKSFRCIKTNELLKSRNN